VLYSSELEGRPSVVAFSIIDSVVQTGVIVLRVVEQITSPDTSYDVSNVPSVSCSGPPTQIFIPWPLNSAAVSFGSL